MKNRPLLFLLSAIFSVGLFLLPSHEMVRAFSLQPALLELEADPGGEVSGVINVGNDDHIRRRFYVTVQKFVPSGEEGRQQFLSPDEQEGLPSWMKIATTTELGAGETGQVRFTVHVPQNAAPGGYYGAIFFAASDIQSGADRIAMGSRTGSLLFFTVRGAAKPDLHLQTFLAAPSRSYWWPEGFEVRLQNRGMLHATPRGFVTVRNFFGQVSYLIPLNAEGARVLPQSTRRLILPWEQGRAEQGFWKAMFQEVSFFGFGPYRAEITWSDDQLERGESIRFFILPWRLLTCVMFVSVFFLVLLREMRRKMR